jgi:peptidoglycan/LPS O-acetylase OafA/YrhL
LKLAEIAVATGGAYLIFAAGFYAFGGRSLLHNKPDISYGIYLYAWPLQMLFVWMGVTQPPLLFALSLVTSMLLGYLSWHLIEKHALELGRLVKRRESARVLSEA